jgi:hypothetical protein
MAGRRYRMKESYEPKLISKPPFPQDLTSAPPFPQDLTVDALKAEMVRARIKFPDNRHLLAALVEEVGELAKAILQDQGDDQIEREGLQVACVALRIVEEGDSAFQDKNWDTSL